MKSKLKKWYRKSKGYIALGLAVLTLLYTSLVNFMIDKVQAEGANDRVTTFIQLAQGQSISEEMDIGSLSKEELRFLGVYLSNYFIPFGSELGVAADNEDTVQQMVDALCLNMNWDEEMAYILVEEILGLSRANDVKLEIYGSKGYQDGDYVKIENMECNYYNFLRLMLGAEESVISGYTSSDSNVETSTISYKDWYELSPEEQTAFIEEGYVPAGINGFVKKDESSSGLAQLYNGDIKYIYFGYEQEGSFIPIFDASLIPSVQTASQITFRTVLGSIDTEQGYGFSFFDLTTNEIETDELNGLDVSELELLNLSIYGQNMYVDCFGNIIQKGAAHQYIVIPACMNPYIWTPVNEEGEDCMKPGISYNIINFNAMALADINSLILQHSIALDYPTGILKEYQNSNTVEEGEYTGTSYEDLYDYMISQELNFYEGNSNTVGRELVNIESNSIALAATFQVEDDIPYAHELGFYNGAAELDWEWFAVEGDSDIYPLRVIRGSSEYYLANEEGVLFFNSYSGKSYFSTIKDAEEAFKSTYPSDKSYYMADDGGLQDIKECLEEDTDEGYELAAKSSAVGIEEYALADLPYIFESLDEQGNAQIYTYENKLPITNKLYIIDNMVFIDNLGAYQLSDGGNIDYSVINFAHYLDTSGSSPNKLLESYANDPANGYASSFETIQSGKLNTTVQVSEAAVSSVYSTYLIASLYKNTTESKKETIGQLGFRLNKEGLPKIENAPISIPNSYEVAIIEKQIMEWTYYLLNPTEGLDYVSLLIKNKTNALLVGWHNDMVGTNGVGAITGTTQYRSAIGFVTTPELSEIQWTATLISLYNKIIPFLIIAMLVIMLFSYVAGILQFQKALFGVIIFAIFLFMPVSLIHNAISISNGISQKIYSDRFTYWAIIQQESYVKNLDEAIDADTYTNYLRELYALNNEVYANQGGDSIVLKWQAPKKMASLVITEKDNQMVSHLDTNLLSMVLNSNTMSGEYFTDSEANYMFRSYTDLGNFSRFIYGGIKRGTKESDTVVCLDNLDLSLQASLNSMHNDMTSDAIHGFTNSNGTTQDYLRVVKPLSSDIYNSALKQKGTIKDLTINDYVGLHQDLFQFDIAMFNNSDKEFVDTMILPSNTKDKQGLIDVFAHYGDDVEKELTGLAAYGLMSESPYYYFSWYLYDMGMSPEPGSKGNYKNLILGKENGGFFYNLDGKDNSMGTPGIGSNILYDNGELKDFMDMKSLFTYIIPYLKAGNDIVREWDEVYGIYLYEGVPTEEGHQNDPDILASPELQQKYWHNLNVARLYCIYTPWVDLMYDCSYADAETIMVMGEKYVVKDPINPASYPDERPMIFSESEMAVYGLTEADLTEVEKKILECNRQYEERLYDLLNYYNFSDVTLNSSASINCTFVFNSVFSETNILGESINLYPQSFEINNFSYDAFLRFILANSLGEDLTNQEDFYMAVVEKSSTTTAIMYIISDLFSQYALPAVKIFIIIIIFISSILLILVTAFRVDPKQKFIPSLIKSLISPMLSYLLINIGFAWILSLFMGTGNNAVTQSKQVVIQMGDPVIVMLIITALDVICMVLYWKIIKSVIEDIKKNSSLAKSFISGSIGGTFAMAGNFVSSKISGNNVTSASHNGGYNEEGSSRVSPRASQRGSMDVTESSCEESSRISEAKRETYKEDKSERNTRSSKEGKNRINNTIKSGSKKLSSGSNRNS